MRDGGKMKILTGNRASNQKEAVSLAFQDSRNRDHES